MELKLTDARDFFNIISSNRTFMELKYHKEQQYQNQKCVF